MAATNDLFDQFRRASGAYPTTCSVCNRKLKDATSIERGVGPVCYGKFASIVKAIGASNDEWVRKLIPFAFSKDRTALIMAHYSYESIAFVRQLANVIVYHLSKELRNLTKVQIGNNLRLLFALGYFTLAWRIMKTVYSFEQQQSKPEDEDDGQPRWYVTHAYAKAVIEPYKELGGKWDSDRGAWVFEDAVLASYVFQTYLSYRTGDLDEFLEAQTWHTCKPVPSSQ